MKKSKTHDERIKEMADSMSDNELEPKEEDGQDLDGDNEEGEPKAHKEKVKKGLFGHKGLHIIISMGKGK